MKSIGEVLGSARRLKGLTIVQLSRVTKIKREFLMAIEKSEWQKLPDYPVLLGFIKNIAKALDIDEIKAVSLFRRDYPKPQIFVNPKQPHKEGFRWNPKFSLIVGVIVLLIAMTGYLGHQYFEFSRSPNLEIFEPTQDQIVKKSSLKVTGKTDPSATILVNNQPVLVDEAGTFTTELDIFEGTQEVKVIASSRSGKASTLSRTIKPDLNLE